MLEVKTFPLCQRFSSGREFIVSVNSTDSDIQEQEMGIPQVCILSATLFRIKINSIAKF